MVELSEMQHKKLKDDADDNNQIRRIVLYICITIISIVLIFTIVPMIVSAFLEPKLNDNEYQKQLLEAKARVEIREIEQGDLTFEQYVQWLDASNPGITITSQK